MEKKENAIEKNQKSSHFETVPNFSSSATCLLSRLNRCEMHGKK